jgi:tRNA (guanine37-N1)-methyltransferase
MKSLKSEFKEAEKIKQYLIKNNLLNQDYLVKRTKQHIYFPLKEIKKLNKKYISKISNVKLEKYKKKLNFKQLLQQFLSEQEYESLPKAYDVVGTIAILEIPEELRKKEKKIAKSLLDSNKNIKTVLRKADIHKGKFRTQKMKFLAGISSIAIVPTTS